MASKSLNIEVGKRICKMCMTVSKGKAFQVSDSFVFATPDGAVVDGQIVNPAIMGEAIRDEMNLHNININNCVFSVASSKIAVREVNVPAIKDDQIKSIVATNASDYFPVDIFGNYRDCVGEFNNFADFPEGGIFEEDIAEEDE